MTNFQRIRCMNDDELAEFLKNIDVCPEEGFSRCNQSESCHSCWKAWLEEESADNGKA